MSGSLLIVTLIAYMFLILCFCMGELEQNNTYLEERSTGWRHCERVIAVVRVVSSAKCDNYRTFQRTCHLVSEARVRCSCAREDDNYDHLSEYLSFN